LQDPPEITDLDEPAGYVAPLESSDLTGVGAVFNSFLCSEVYYFMKSGLSTFFRSKFLTQRDSDMTSEEFINSLVDYRMQAVSAQRELSTTDYEAVSDDGIFVKSLVILP
jgi:hypothetical protein